MQHIRINLFHLADLEDVVKIESAAFPGDAYPAEAFLELQQECPGFFLVAKSYRTVVGYVAASVQGKNAEIVSVAVDPKHRGRGIAKALMMHMLAKLKPSGVRRVVLAVRPENVAAMGLYSNLGFHRVRRIRRYYADGSDAFEMQTLLPSAARTAETTI